MTKKADPKLVVFTPAVGFTGYPFGDAVHFDAGGDSIPVPEDFAILMREKGHVAPGTQFREPKKETE
ncbi:hypothetical protein [Rhizobium sp. Leaf386]|uniref:hypothetical protein n=1 Tax=Rhizobium sp. Leaf386 TaxID=1736359 RepID=UPI0007129B3A|nr:hypothetical protein [Rhizobium sp. Leaf386]KQS95395.1 hypothetical protein ASG50_25560 [Rhizobium sp. Leaf386]